LGNPPRLFRTTIRFCLFTSASLLLTDYVYFFTFAFLLFPFYLFSLNRRVMTRRRLFLSHIRCVAIGALACFFELIEFGFDRYRFWISRLLTVAMTRRTRIYRHIRGQATRRAGARDVDVTGRAFGDVLTFAAFVSKLRGNALSAEFGDERCRWFMTTRAVVCRRLLIFPMTVEARIMTARH
jgi:hypothetical protein